MPEGIEAEIYRRAARAVVGRTVSHVWVDDRCGDLATFAPLEGATVTDVRRHGKVVVLDTERMSVGMHFAMTGRLIVDGDAPIAELAYGARRDDPAWDRWVMTFADGGVLRVNDPRRWSRYVADPIVGEVGVDLYSPAAAIADALNVVGRRRALKSVLLDQAVVAGIGNLIADEVASAAEVAPRTPIGDVDVGVVARAIEATVHLLDRQGGSHTGDLGPARRHAGAVCPIDGSELAHDTVAGRSTYWCPQHQGGT
ncbi:MAG: hypothetical protein O3A28_09110 [Actinomycetota bacterium]|nr:hypothetical protein [Actinomycetota bacterium]MDA3008101.1 hypothetical protein [Actinomycetota bacterium]MDA3035170.1 hypothetical protein [Actinomycetota bacterium]